jgi:hypothetical protein
MKPRDLVVHRYWRREDDGSYGILIDFLKHTLSSLWEASFPLADSWMITFPLNADHIAIDMLNLPSQTIKIKKIHG